ncbi:MAG: S4 domain-containing protein [Clostridium fessum]
MMQEYLVPEEAAGTRIDKFLADACPDLSRSFLQKLLKESSVTADGKAVKSSFKVNGGKLSPLKFQNRRRRRSRRKISRWTFCMKIRI